MWKYSAPICRYAIDYLVVVEDCEGSERLWPFWSTFNFWQPKLWMMDAAAPEQHELARE
jgi:hypothetical protein